MAWNRIRKDDQCAYNKELSESTSALGYIMDPNKYYSCSPCRIEFGLVGGNDVSITEGNMVDVESELMNLTRQLSVCPERKYLPFCERCEENEDGLPCGSASCKRQEPLKHLPACNMIQYRPRIDHVGVSLSYPGCPIPVRRSVDGVAMKYPPQINPVQWTGQSKLAKWQEHKVNRDPASPGRVAYL